MLDRIEEEIRSHCVLRFGRDWLVRAAQDFEDPEVAAALFIPWSVYVASERGKPPAAWFLDERGSELDHAGRELVCAQLAAPVSIFEVTQVSPFESVTVRDLVAGGTRLIADRSRVLPKDVILGRVVELGGAWFFGGVHPQPLSRADAGEIVQRAHEEQVEAGEVLGRWLIRRWEEAIFDVGERMKARGGLTTNDHFLFAPSDRAAIVARLRSIPGARGEAGEEDLEFAHGKVRVSDGAFTLETNSLHRADVLRAQVEAACGPLARHGLRDHGDPSVNRLESRPRHK